MNVLSELKNRFRPLLAQWADDPSELLDMIKPSQDPKFGDYQANCAMPLGKRLGKPPRAVAADIVDRIDVADLCVEPEIAGPGFINLRLKDEWIVQQLSAMLPDERLGIAPVEQPKTFVIDYSSPNVAKPMHVGHIRSTVIGDAICRTLRFLGHRAIGDNHLGDWGTQFGMIIYGYKHFVDREAYDQAPVAELTRLYKLVNQLIEYHDGKQKLPTLQQQAKEIGSELETQRNAEPTGDKAADKKARRALNDLGKKLKETESAVQSLTEKIESVESSPSLLANANEHREIAAAVLAETAKLHAGDDENQKLWNEFLPHCRQEIQRIYDRLHVEFDCEYGESFYHEQLAPVVADFEQRGLATESDGATCVFIDGFDTPMIIRKQDGAYLYATTDLATIQYRMKTWQPDAMLYVTDHRQSEHFDKLFTAARLWGFTEPEYCHVSFGTVLGDDGKPYKTRSGDTVGLEGLLDEAVAKAYEVVSEKDDNKKTGPELTGEERKHIANVIGHAAIKYADLSQNRTSDYVFSYDKMVAFEGNTATYMQFSYARTQNIIAKSEVNVEDLLASSPNVRIDHPMERALAIELLKFSEAVNDAVEDYRPNQLTSYLFDIATQFSRFYEKCHVLKAEDESLRNSRLLLCDLTGRTIRQGLALLGINVVAKM